jgi:hypothetical protein
MKIIQRRFFLYSMLSLNAAVAAVAVVAEDGTPVSDSQAAAVLSADTAAGRAEQLPAGGELAPTETVVSPAPNSPPPAPSQAAAETAEQPVPVEAGGDQPVSAETSGDEGPADQVQLLVPAPPPPSLQTLVDERRDQLRERHRAMFETMRARSGYLYPWMTEHDRTMDGYRDTMRRLYRQQRDYSQRRHDTLMDAMCPWSKPQRDRFRVRSYLSQMEQLDRREAWSARMGGWPYALSGPLPW